MAKITFLGAAETVTGSKYLVEAGGKRLLVDCGLFEGSRELKQRNWERLPIDPASIDWLILTHAHIDHTGYLPRLVRDGYRGPIYANAATQELCGYLLPDSAHLQEEDALYAGKKGYSRHKPALPLYTVPEAQTALQRFQPIARMDPFTISPQFKVQPYDAGHILGSSSLELTITENGKSIVVVFSGDIGRYDAPILKNPQTPARADYLLCETTYGDRVHPIDAKYDMLADAVTRTAKRGGVVVIPAFAVGRTQTLMYVLRQLADWQRIPRLPVYVDSPMAINVTDLYVRHHEDHNLDLTREENGGDPLNLRDGAPDAGGGRFEADQQRQHTLHHYFRQRDGDRGPDFASSGATFAGFAKLRADYGIPGASNSGTGLARPCTDGAHPWRRCAGAGRNCRTLAVFSTRRPDGTDSLALWIERTAEANVSSSWRAVRDAIVPRDAGFTIPLADHDSQIRRDVRVGLTISSPIAAQGNERFARDQRRVHSPSVLERSAAEFSGALCL